VLSRARTFPSGDGRRWQIIGELATADFAAAFARASTLLRTADPESMTLGAEVCDQLFVGMREGRRFAPEAVGLLREICRPTQFPEVLAAALHPYAQLSPQAAAPLLYELLDHADALVRRAAAQLVATAGAEFAEDRQVDSLIRLLDEDPDPGVRERAAEGLDLIVTCYAYVPQSPRIVDALARHVDDRNPGIRASALTAGIATADVEAAVKVLVDELSDADVAWQFVDAFSHLPPLEGWFDELRSAAHAALRRLLELGWPDRGDPACFPLAQERAEMLARAINTMAPDSRVLQARPRRAGRLRGP
jgi:hypothetical protein